MVDYLLQIFVLAILCVAVAIAFVSIYKSRETDKSILYSGEQSDDAVKQFKVIWDESLFTTGYTREDCGGSNEFYPTGSSSFDYRDIYVAPHAISHRLENNDSLYVINVKCNYCGATNTNKSLECHKCGAPLPVVK